MSTLNRWVLNTVERLKADELVNADEVKID
jgi:hypothetical protein